MNSCAYYAPSCSQGQRARDAGEGICVYLSSSFKAERVDARESKAVCLHAESGWMQLVLSTVAQKRGTHWKEARPAEHRLATSGKRKQSYSVSTLNGCALQPGSTQSWNRKEKPSPLGSCHLNLSGKHCCRSEWHRERIWPGHRESVGKSWTLEGERECHTPNPRVLYPHLESGLWELNRHSHFYPSDMFTGEIFFSCILSLTLITEISVIMLQITWIVIMLRRISTVSSPRHSGMIVSHNSSFPLQLRVCFFLNKH